MLTIDQIKKAHYATAKIVEKLGDDYLIFFERIHQELIEAERKKDLKAIAFDVAKR